MARLKHMWQQVEQAISYSIGERFTIKHQKAISRTEHNTCFWLSNYHHNYFIKLNDKAHFEHLESEAYSLAQIKHNNQVACPDVISLGTTLDKSFLVLNYITLSNASKNNWYFLGTALAKMHKHSIHGQFGWEHDNYIGNTRQPNNWQRNWRTFFAEQRIGWQLQLLREKSIKLGDIDHIINVCHDALLHHQVEPCLVHGDLWKGNLGFSGDNSYIFDPASYYGDREVDIAMTELFGDLPADFYQGYQDYYPLSADYDKRKLVYNFYHILNHANLFGGVYIEQSKASLARILALH